MRALPGYSPERRSSTGLSGLRGRAVAVVVVATMALAGLPGLGYAVAAHEAHSASEGRYEAADREFAEASAAYSAARAVEMEASGEPPPENALEAVEMYLNPDTDTGRELQGDMSVAAEAWRSAAEET